jgi:sirohydrochlorin ferrochelatase
MLAAALKAALVAGLVVDVVLIVVLVPLFLVHAAFNMFVVPMIVGRRRGIAMGRTRPSRTIGFVDGEAATTRKRSEDE